MAIILRHSQGLGFVVAARVHLVETSFRHLRKKKNLGRTVSAVTTHAAWNDVTVP
jgi:hypothetical protein